MCGDSVILGLLGQIEETGLYNAALRITGLTIVPMNLALPVFFPMLSAALQEQSADFQPLFDRQVAILIFAAFLTTCLVLPLASPIIEVAFTQRFADAATALRIAIFVSFFQYLWAAYNQVLIVFNQQKRVFVAHVAGAVFNVVLNMFLIPWLSYFGAALASVLTQLLLFCLLLVSVSRLTPVAFSRRLLLSAVIPGMLAGLTVCGTLLLTSGSGAIFLIFAAVAGSVGYSLCFFGIRGLLMSAWVAEVFGDLLTQRGSCGVVDARKR